MKIAIIGASYGQLPLCLKAKEMGLKTICFAWEEGAICRDYVDKFYPISVSETESILNICREERVDGVVSNASDLLAETVAFLTENLGLNGNSVDVIRAIKNKYRMRCLTSEIENLKNIRFYKYASEVSFFFPCIVKPLTGNSKKGVCFVKDVNDFENAIRYSKKITQDIIIEEYIVGREFSVETISFKGEHYVVQITDKENSGPLHFIELAHHQPADLSTTQRDLIEKVVCKILRKINFNNGAAHIEMKMDDNDNLYLIEINPRGGGDEISSKLVQLSTGYDYVKAMIEVALDIFTPPDITSIHFSGIYFLCSQTKERLDFFLQADNKSWLIQKNVKNYELTDASGNYDRNGYVIYQSSRRVNYDMD